MKTIKLNHKIVNDKYTEYLYEAFDIQNKEEIANQAIIADETLRNIQLKEEICLLNEKLDKLTNEVDKSTVEITNLKNEITDLNRKLNINSSNSSTPPSKDKLNYKKIYNN